MNAKKKKKGKEAACNDCSKAAGGDCAKLNSAGFALVGIPGDHERAYYNGVYSKTEQLLNSRHVYAGPNEVMMNAWCFGGWLEAKRALESATAVQVLSLPQLHLK